MQKAQWISRIRRDIVIRSYSSEAVATEQPVKFERKRRVKHDDWKNVVRKVLDTELRKRLLVFKNDKRKQSELANVMRCSVKDDMHGVLRLAENQLRVKDSTEIMPMCLLVLNKRFERYLKTVDSINSDEALRTFVALANFWRGLRRQDNSNNILCLLLISTIRQWKNERKHDAKTLSIEDMFDSMWQKVEIIAKDVNMNDLRIFISESDRSKIEKELAKISKFRFGFKPKSSSLARYQEDLSLVSALQSDCPVEEYNGNPFKLETMSKEQYQEMFEKNLQVERSMWLRVRNPSTSDAMYDKFAEDLIREWKWSERIKMQLDKMNSKDIHPIVGACLEVLPRERLVELLSFCAMSVCSQGQNLVGASQFQYELITPIIRELCNIFKQNVGYNEEKIWTNVFDEYINYFNDADIARRHTHREWWEHACRRANIPPDYQFDMGHLDSATRNEVANVFCSVILDSCMFPVSNENRKTTWVKAFSFRSISIEEESKVTPTSRYNLSRMLAIDNKMMAKFLRNPFKFIIFSTETLPMTVPPRPWYDYGIGGPLYTSRVGIVRNMYEFKSVNLNSEARQRIKHRQQARPVFDALNQLGSTPWVINEKMLDVLKNVFNRSSVKEEKTLLEKLSIPMRSNTISVPEFEDEFGQGARKDHINVEKWRDYARRKAEAIKERNEINSLWCWMLYRVALAEHFRGKTLFFPHNMDFRGRVYPLSPYLSHMGDDVNRCILKFAKPQRLGEHGLDWLKLHCINLTGTMKRAGIRDRMNKVEELLPVILDSARNPLNGERWWMESDEPWQTLAACMEIEDALKYGSDVAQFPSQLPIHQDGSCNGLQHYAALGRDREGGTQVNLTQSELPNDVYSDVALRVEQKRIEDENGTNEEAILARKLRKALPNNVPRKVIKQTVMTTVYGVTMYGAVLQIKRQLRALNIDADDSAVFARYLAEKTFASLNDAFTSSMALKDWFRTCAKGASELMRTTEWVTPLGLPVVQPYCRIVEQKGRLILSPIAMKQIDAFPPNFVHSLDSTHMMLTSLNCARKGLTFAAVHDCFWTHASSVNEMNEICRQQFVDLHSQPIVQQCSEWFQNTYLTKKMQNILPETVFDEYKGMFTAKVEPGKLNIEEVKDSIYFFS